MYCAFNSIAICYSLKLHQLIHEDDIENLHVDDVTSFGIDDYQLDIDSRELYYGSDVRDS